VRRLRDGRSPLLREHYLPALARGEAFLTVGLAQLTTSRQHRPPSLRAEPRPGGGYRLDGEIPWVTGADQADALVIGANVPDGRQVLLVVPTRTPGIAVEPPLPLSSLVGSRTSLVRCANVEVGADALLAGPEAQVLGAAGGGGLDTSCLALGHAGVAIDELRREALARPEYLPLAERFESVRVEARRRLHELAEMRPAAEDVLALRVTCTRLALRATQAALAVAKGAGFVEPHAAQRRARQALFFLVWSCPRPAAEGILADLGPEG
jgi:butyryl-CoA dehydrogenase